MSAENTGASRYTLMVGVTFCWGADPRWASLPISNLPGDAIKVRRRIRNNAFARAYVKTASDLQDWMLAPHGTLKECETLRLACLRGINAGKAVEA